MKTRVAAIQMVSGAALAGNLQAAGLLIAAAAADGARLVALPENFYLIGHHEADKVKLRERDGTGPIQEFLAEAARRHGVWLVGGTAPIQTQDPSRILSASLVFDDSGRRVARTSRILSVSIWAATTPSPSGSTPSTSPHGSTIMVWP